MKNKFLLIFIKIECSTSYCRICLLDLCSECLSSYYLYEDKSCLSKCVEIDGYYLDVESKINLCKSFLY